MVLLWFFMVFLRYLMVFLRFLMVFLKFLMVFLMFLMVFLMFSSPSGCSWLLLAENPVKSGFAMGFRKCPFQERIRPF